MNIPISTVLASAGLIALLSAGETPSRTPSPATEPGYGQQRWFGLPHLQFSNDLSDAGLSVATTSYSHLFAADFDTLPGDVSSDEFSLWAPILPLNRGNMHLLTYLGYGAHRYDTATPNMLPDDTLHSVYLPIAFIHDISEKWMWGAMVMPYYAGNAGSGDSFTTSAGLGVGYSYGPNLDVFAGAYYSHNFGDDFFLPGVAFIWRPAPQWEVYLLPPAGGISYSVNESFMLSLYGQYWSPTWSVKADAGGPDRYVNMSSLRIGLKADFQLHGMWWGFVAGGYSMAQELDVQDSNNSTIQSSDIDPSTFVQAGFNLRF